MTSLVTGLTDAALRPDTYVALATSIGGVVAGLLILLLVQKELLRVARPSRLDTWLSVLNIAIVPLLFAFAMVIIARFSRLLSLF
jgi:hypothetical protein